MTLPVDDLVVSRVRALVRDRGTDPLADPRGVRTAILDVLDELDLDEQTEGAAYADVGAWADELQAAVGGYGPLQRLFDDPEVEEVWVKYRLTTVLNGPLSVLEHILELWPGRHLPSRLSSRSPSTWVSTARSPRAPSRSRRSADVGTRCSSLSAWTWGSCPSP